MWIVSKQNVYWRFFRGMSSSLSGKLLVSRRLYVIQSNWIIEMPSIHQSIYIKYTVLFFHTAIPAFTGSLSKMGFSAFYS